MEERGGEECEELKKEVEKLRNELLYLYAEIDNVKKLMEREVEAAKRSTTERIVSKLITLYEDMERALSPVLEEEREDSSLVKGVKLIVREMERLLKEEGVKFMEVVGKKFDPFFHEAVGYVEDDEVEEGTIVAEVSRGYQLHGKVLKPARVIITKRKTEVSEQNASDQNC